MNSKPLSELLEEAFVKCRDMDASLAERLQAFAEAVRDLGPIFQSSVDDLVTRLRAARGRRGGAQTGRQDAGFRAAR